MSRRLITLLALVLVLFPACDVADKTTLKFHNDPAAAQAMSLARQNGCLNCHGVTNSIVGPAWVLVAERYRDAGDDARSFLIEKVKKGGNGSWNDMTGGAKMPAHGSRVSQQHLEAIVDFILGLKR